MNYQDWYTDTVDVFRIQPETNGALTRNHREQVLAGVACRVFQIDAPSIRMNQTAAAEEQQDWLQCDNTVDIRAGDELLIHRGAKLGAKTPVIRAFAASPNYFFEPFGAVVPGLAHQEIRLLQQERVS